MRAQMERYDKLRERVIVDSRSILKGSKKAIYAAHRGELAQATKLLETAKKAIAKVDELVSHSPALATTGAYSDALEEYAEAALYIHYLKTKKIATPTQIGAHMDVYLPALSDLTGELVRKAINSSVAGDHETAFEIKDVVDAIYAELMLFDWRNSPVRRKFDAIKYNLEKLEDLALKIRFK